MAPNQKAKRDLQKLKIRKDKPAVSMIDKDGPIVDSPVAIDSGERYPEGPQDVRVFTVRLCTNPVIVLTFFCSSVRAEPLRYDTLGA